MAVSHQGHQLYGGTVWLYSLGSHTVVQYCGRNAIVQLLRLLLWIVRSTRQHSRAEHSSADAMLRTALDLQLHQPRAATIHRGPLARLSRASKRYISTGIPQLAANRTPLL